MSRNYVNICIAIGMLAGSLAVTGSAKADTIIVNPLSQFEIFVDGQFTSAQEWSDVKPGAFISDILSPNPGPAQPTSNKNAANSFLYAAIAPGTAAEAPALYLMYDYLPRTSPAFTPGEFVADIKFPINIAGNQTPITVEVRAGGIGATSVTPDAVGFGFTFNVRNNATQQLIFGTGIEGAVGFGFSPSNDLSKVLSHMMVELEVPLLIPEGFSTILKPNNGVYSPAPAFWGAFIADDVRDPPASSALFRINPDASTTIVINDVPEPSTLALSAIGLAGVWFAGFRRRAKR